MAPSSLLSFALMLTLAYGELSCPTLFNYYPDVHDCTKFYRCNWGKASLFVCPAGTRWSQSLLTCDHEYNVPCHKTPSLQLSYDPHHGYIKTPDPFNKSPDFSVDYDQKDNGEYDTKYLEKYRLGGIDYAHEKHDYEHEPIYEAHHKVGHNKLVHDYKPYGNVVRKYTPYGPYGPVYAVSKYNYPYVYQDRHYGYRIPYADKYHGLSGHHYAASSHNSGLYNNYNNGHYNYNAGDHSYNNGHYNYNAGDHSYNNGHYKYNVGDHSYNNGHYKYNVGDHSYNNGHYNIRTAPNFPYRRPSLPQMKSPETKEESMFEQPMGAMQDEPMRDQPMGEEMMGNQPMGDDMRQQPEREQRVSDRDTDDDSLYGNYLLNRLTNKPIYG